MPNLLEKQTTDADVSKREWKVPMMLALIGLGCISWGIHRFARDQRAHNSWPKTNAQVVSVPRGRYDFPNFRFRYAVSDVSFVKENNRPFQVYATTTTTVYYNPVDPSDFIPSEAMFYDSGIAILLGFGCVVASCLRRRSSAFRAQEQGSRYV